MWAGFAGLFWGQLVLAQSIHRVEGQITPPSKAASLPVILLRYDSNIKDAPPMSPLARTSTDSDGRFFFNDVQAEAGISYLIGYLFEGQRIASKPFSLNQPTVRIDLQLPSIREGLDAAIIRRSALVLHQIPEAVRITEIISLENPTQNTLDGSKTPWEKQLPEQAMNFQSFTNQADTQINEQNGTVQILFSVPPGRAEVLFEYEIPAASNQVSFKHYFWQQERSLELITPENSLVAEIAGQSFSEKPQLFNQRQYRVLSFFLPQDQNYALIKLSNLPLPKVYFVFILGVILLILLAGLAYGFMKVKKSTAPQPP